MAARVWNAITKPVKIMLYTGSGIETDWKKRIRPLHGLAKRTAQNFKIKEGCWKVIRTYFYNLLIGIGGDADLPGYHSEITYGLRPAGENEIALTYHRANIATELEKQIFEAHLQSMFYETKELQKNSTGLTNNFFPGIVSPFFNHLCHIFRQR